MHAQIFADHLARRRLVIDHHDVRIAHVVGNVIVNAVPTPLEGADAEIVPSCRSTIRLTIDRPRPVELSSPVGFAERRWNRPNNRDTSSGDNPGPSSTTLMQVAPEAPVADISILPDSRVYLIALLTRLSIASRMWSASQGTMRRAGTATAIVCPLCVALGWFASATDRTIAAISTG